MQLLFRHVLRIFSQFAGGAVWLLTAVPTLLAHLTTQPLGRRRALIVVVTALVGVYAAEVFRYVTQAPEIGIRCAFSPVVMHVDRNFLVEPSTAQPKLPGKTIVQVGTQPVKTWPDLLRAVREIRKQPTRSLAPEEEPGPADTHIVRDGEEQVRVQLVPGPGRAGSWSLFPRVVAAPGLSVGSEATESIWVRVGRLPTSVLLASLVWFLLKAGLLAVGALVFWKRPDDRSAAQFFFLCAVTTAAHTGGYHWSRIIARPDLLVVFMVCGLLLPAASLHFYLIFPRPKAALERWARWALLVIYGLPSMFLLLLILDYSRAYRLYWEGSHPDTLGFVLQGILAEVYSYFGVAALWYLAGVVCLVHSYRTAADPTERNQVKWILFGVASAVVPIGYTLYLAFVDPDGFGGGGATWPMFFASFFVTFAFTISITRYRLMQLDQLIGSGVIYFLLSSLAGIVYYAVLFGGTLMFSAWFVAPSLPQALAVSSAALVLLVVLDWIRSRVKRALDRRFVRQKHNLERTLQRMSQALEQLVDPPTLARRLLREAAELLGVNQGAVYLRDGSPALFRLADHIGRPPPLSELPPGAPLIAALQAEPTLTVHTAAPPWAAPLRTTNGAEPREEPAQRQLRFLDGAVAHALTHEGCVLAILILGPKQGGAYGIEDLNLLSAFAQVAVPALVSAEGHRTIEALTIELQEKVAKIAEQQRRILALQSQLMQGSEVREQRSEVSKDSPVSLPSSDVRPLPPASGIVGSSPQIRQLLQDVRKYSHSQATVLIRGESGTGKELLARALHEGSPRASKPFIKVHCAALAPGLLESELFGHVKGAFTGAHRDKVGRFELAHGGTLFLDEIGDISLEVQTKLLRVLQEMTFERVGSSDPVRVDVRVITATHQDLEELMAEKRFREDLYYRLNVIPIQMPPLRERKEDIPELAAHFLRQAAQEANRPVAQLDDDALALLKAFAWPGNIRQLENVIARAVVVAEGPTVTVQDLPAELWQPATPPEEEYAPSGNGNGELVAAGVGAERAERERRERDQLVRALAVTNGNKAEAARALGLARSTFLSRLKKHGLT